MSKTKLSTEQELECIILQGFCPYCHSRHVKYHEIAKNYQFEFDCRHCGWERQYNLEQFLGASRPWILKSKHYRNGK